LKSGDRRRRAGVEIDPGREYNSHGKGFMDKEWDSCVPSPELWRQAFRVLKPGGHLVAFAGSRTADLTSISLRLAGFEIRDVIQWHKSRNIGEQFGQNKTAIGSALKPSHEPIILARKPLQHNHSLAENTRKWRTGGINIDETRLGDTSRPNGPAGRWPAKLLLSHSPDCRCVGERRVSSSADYSASRSCGWFGRLDHGTPEEQDGHAHHHGQETITDWSCVPGCPGATTEAGREGRSRYFGVFHGERPEAPAIEAVLDGSQPNFCYSPKPSTREREAGLAEAASRAKPERR
jgi:hypothetical protein